MDVHSLPLSLARRYLPQWIEGWTGLDTSWMVALATVLLLGVILRRHGLVYYGSDHSSHWGYPTLLVLLFPLVLFPVHSFIPLSLIFLDIWLEKLFNKIGREKKFFSLFDQGFILGMLFLVHPSLLCLCAVYLLAPSTRSENRFRGIASFFLGLTALLWIYFLLFCPPSLSGFSSLIVRLFEPFSELSLTTRSLPEWYLITSIGITLLVYSFAGYTFYTSAVEKHRMYLSTHLFLSWLLYALYLLYGSTVFLAGVLYFASILIQLLMTTKRSLLMRLLLYLPLVVTMLLLFSQTLNFHA